MRRAQYEILERLNHDGWAQLYRARDPEGHVVLLHDATAGLQASETDEDRAALAEYLRKLTTLDHPNVERITEVGTQALWFAGEYFDYQLSLDHCMRDKAAPCSREQRVSVVLDVLAALQYAHERGLVHTAINPTNVVVLDNGRAKVLKFVEGSRTQRALRRGQLSGATHYMAPEFIREGVVSPAMDVFATGVLLYRVLVGAYPFQGKDGPSVLDAIVTQPPRPMAEKCEQCAAQLGEVVERALAKDPKERFPSAAAFAGALRAVK